MRTRAQTMHGSAARGRAPACSQRSWGFQISTRCRCWRFVGWRVSACCFAANSRACPGSSWRFRAIKRPHSGSDSSRPAPAGAATLEVLRIEAGIPWLGRDLDETVLPPETGRKARGVSYTKGCYLGQEILERMRSRGSLGRRLVRLRLARGGDPRPPAAICQEGIEVGRLTSAACHPLSGEWIGLGYVRTTVGDATGLTVGAAAIAVDSVEPV